MYLICLQIIFISNANANPIIVTDQSNEAMVRFENIHNQSIYNLHYSNITLTDHLTVIDFTDVSNLILKNITITSIQTTIENVAQIYAIRLINSQNVTIENLNIAGLRAKAIVGLGIINSSQIHIGSSELSNFQTHEVDITENTGIVISNSNNITIENTVIRDLNSSGYQLSTTYAVSLYKTSVVKLHKNNFTNLNTISNIANSFAIHALESSFVNVTDQYIHNIISSIYDYTNISSYSTGIYFALSRQISIRNNQLDTVKNTGTAAYAMFIDKSQVVLIENNNVTKTLSNGARTNLGTGIVFRSTNEINVLGNNITNTNANYVAGVSEGLASAVSIIADNSVNVSIRNNYIEKTYSSSYDTGTDSVGILIGSASHIEVVDNDITDIVTLSNGDDITSGIVMSSVDSGLFQGNSMSNLQGTSNYGIFMTGIKNVEVIDNTISDLIGWKIKALYASLSSNLHIININISNLVSPINQGIRIAWVENVIVENSIVSDFSTARATVGIYVAGESSSIILNNTFINKTEWLKVDDASEVYCDQNIVNNTLLIGCGQNVTDFEIEVTENKNLVISHPAIDYKELLENANPQQNRIVNAGATDFHVSSPMIVWQIMLIRIYTKKKLRKCKSKSVMNAL